MPVLVLCAHEEKFGGASYTSPLARRIPGPGSVFHFEERRVRCGSELDESPGWLVDLCECDGKWEAAFKHQRREASFDADRATLQDAAEG